MKKRLIVFFTIFAILLVMINPTYVMAFNAEEHDSYMEQVLFGDISFKDSKSQDVKDKIKMLEYASYLCVDQDRGEGTVELQFLKKQKVKSLPKLDDFDLTGVFYGNHRNYTHRGWDFDYIVPKGEKHDKANWPVRKALLCSTTNKIFDFGFKNEMFGNVCNQCNSFSAMIYYVHILGDHIEKDNYKVSDLTIPLARDNADENNPDVFFEIRKHSEVLFAGQKNTTTYDSYIQEIDNIAEKARKIARGKGGVNDNNFAEYHKCAEDLMETLITYVPLLLENEEFFKNEFYK